MPKLQVNPEHSEDSYIDQDIILLSAGIVQKKDILREENIGGVMKAKSRLMPM